MKQGIRDTSAQDIVHEPTGKAAKRVKIALALVLVLVLAAVLYSVLGRWMSADATISSERIRTAQVMRGDLLRDINVQGTIVAAISPTLYSPANGTLTLDVQEGDTVTEGQVLAVLDSPEVQSEFEQGVSTLAASKAESKRQEIQARKAQVASRQVIDLAQVRLTAAQREMRRAEESIKIGAISQIDYERYRDDLATAEVEYKHATQDAELEKDSLEFEVQTRRLAAEREQLVVDNLKRRVDDLTIRSPVDGIIGNIEPDQKAVVAPNQPLITVVDLSAFEVEVRVPESYADDMGIGMAAEIQFNNRIYPGMLASLSPEVINSEVVGRIRFSDEMPENLRQNQRLTSRIVMDHLEDVLKLQRGSFTDSGGGRAAFVLGDDGMAHRRSIVLGARSVSDVEVISGLQEGETVLISSIAEFEGLDQIQISN
jgi:HlyD family secretion protein